MKRLACAAVLALALLAPERLMACSCVAPPRVPPSEQERLASVDVAFRGRVTHIRRVRRLTGGHERQITFVVQRVLKGDVGPVVRVRTGMYDADCGVKVEKRRTYTVYAHSVQGHLRVGLCRPPVLEPASPSAGARASRSPVRRAAAPPIAPSSTHHPPERR